MHRFQCIMAQVGHLGESREVRAGQVKLLVSSPLWGRQCCLEGHSPIPKAKGSADCWESIHGYDWQINFTEVTCMSGGCCRTWSVPCWPAGSPSHSCSPPRRRPRCPCKYPHKGCYLSHQYSSGNPSSCIQSCQCALKIKPVGVGSKAASSVGGSGLPPHPVVSLQ